MDKYEYKVRAEEIKTLIAKGEFAEAVKIADTIDWHRVKSVMMLCTISDLYKINRRFQESKDILLMAYERHPGGRLIVYSLCELSIKMGEFVQAIEYYKEFVQIAPKDTGKYILQYKLYEAQDVSLEERIAVLEEFKKRDYREKWAYELAYLYHRVGLETKCVEECDEMILWFGEGRYVLKAMELKQLHQPLNETQQELYFRMKHGVEEEQEPEKEQPEEAEETGEEPEEETAGGIPEMEEEPEESGQEEDFKVKTVDLGQYNTINLEKELAESMKEIFEDDGEDDGGDSGKEAPEKDSLQPFVKSIVAPLLQETGDIPQEGMEKPSDALQIGELEFLELDEDEDTDLVEIPAKEEQAQEPEAVRQRQEPSIALEEVFFEEDIKDILQQDTKRINMGDTKEIAPKRKVVYPSTLPSRLAMTQQNEPLYQVEAKPEEAVPVLSSERQEIIQAQPNLMKSNKPSGFEQMLSQEYDGQISLVVPNGGKVEKQITGQMNITDIMAEWERTKRENEEKRREDVRKRVQKHTGNMLSEFDEATKSGLLEQLEKAVVEAILRESGQNAMDPSDISEQRLDDIVKSVGRKQEASATLEAQEKEAQEKEAREKEVREKEAQEKEKQEAPVDSADVSMAADAPVPDEEGSAEALEAIPAEGRIEEQIEGTALEETAAEDSSEDVPEEETPEENPPTENILTDNIPINEIKEMAENLRKEEADRRSGAKTAEQPVQEGKTDAHTEHKGRLFTIEEKELFGRFSHNRKSREQIFHAIDEMSMDSYSGNVVVTGEEEAGTLDLAKNLVRMMQLTDRNFSGKVAKISGETLNKKDVPATLAKLADGALIIEHATDMSSGTATDLNKALAKENRGIFVIMEGKRDEMNIFLRKNRALMDNFNARVDIDSLDDQALVEYAKLYAGELEYSIDELGILALHTRIADMQTSDHEVTVAEVKDLVDDAIYFADKKNPRHFFDVLFGKRYDAEDMIILREKDFMHY